MNRMVKNLMVVFLTAILFLSSAFTSVFAEEEADLNIDQTTETVIEPESETAEELTEEPVIEEAESEESEQPAEEIEAAETEPETEPVEVVTIEQTGEYNGIEVNVSYTSDTFEKEATLVVSAAGETEDAALSDAFGESYIAVDISFVDAEGNELQPINDKGVKVGIHSKDMNAGNYSVLHVDENGNIDPVDDIIDISASNKEVVEQTILVPEEVEVPVYEEQTVVVPEVKGTRTVEKTRDVEKTRLVKVKVAVKWYDPSTWKGYKYVEEKYTVPETYYEDEEYVITPEHEETTQVQVGTEWVETGEMITVTQNAEVEDVDAEFVATGFSTYAIYTTTITSGQEYAIYRDGYALTHALGRLQVTVSGNAPNQSVESTSDDIKWLFESSGTGYKISYSNNGTKTYLRANGATLTVTTNQNDSGTTWNWDANSTRLSTSVDYTTYYLKYRNNQWQSQAGSGNRSVSIAEVQSGSAAESGIHVHYVDAEGNVIKTFTVDGASQDYCDISETISVATASTDHFNTYTATSGTIYDLVFEIEGYTYNSTYLTSYTSASEHGTEINAEVFRRNNGYWAYTNYGGDSATSASDHTEDIHNFGNITDVYVVYDSNSETPDDPGEGGEEELDAPSTGKEVVPNGDGTSTLSLSIAGSSKDVSKNIGANVIVIFDKSNSMTTTRLTEAKTAARTVATNLLGLNGTDAGSDPLVEMLLISFGATASPSATETGTWYTAAGPNNATQTTTGFNGAVNAITNQQGTNWEAALQSALAHAQSHLTEEAQREGRSDPDSPDYERVDNTYIIFITDGQPSMKAGDTSYSDETTTADFYTRSNYVRATDEARAMVEAGYDFYSIGIYGTIEVLHYLTDFAFTGRSTYDSSKSTTNNANGHFYSASTYSALTEALGQIADTISGKLAVAGVSITDGIATSVTSTNISANNASGFKYTVKTAGGQIIYEVSIDNNNNATYKFGPGSDYNGETFTVASNASGTAGTGSNGTAYTATAETVSTSFDWISPDGTQTGTKTSSNMVYTVKIGETEYKMSPASVDENGEVKWDLAGVGTIDSGYVWTVSFIIWPDQDAYDIVTDLNNGIETTYKWIDFDPNLDPSTECARAEYKDLTLQYYYDGVFVQDENGNWVKSQYTHIVKYPDGHYAALTNTHQDVEYFIFDEETGTYIGPVNHQIDPPKPISLDAALATVQKKWEVDLDKEQLVYALFNTRTGESNNLQVTMHVFEDHEGDEYDFADQYTEKTLGWQTDTSAYDWADETEDIELYGRTYTVGTVWEDDLSIAIGVMIDEDRAIEYGLTDNPYALINNKKYYVLEHGHDYDIVESGFANYRFDYISHTYHPMLVDGVMYDLQNMHIGGTDEEGKQYYVYDAVEPISALIARNTLRGGINITKATVDEEGNRYDSDALFTFDVKLDHETENTYTGENTPWYSVTNGKTYEDGSLIYYYYHDEEGNKYQAAGVIHDEATGAVTFTLYDEEGNSYNATSADFNEDVGPADITYTNADGEEVSVALYGNVLAASNSGKTAEVSVSIHPGNVIRIANVPYKTTYSIKETEVLGFDLIEIEQTIQATDDAADEDKTVTTLTEEVVEDEDIEALKIRESDALIGIVDEIVPNNQNNIKFTNQITSDAFYVYHSFDNTVEKILFADNRVNQTYDETDGYSYTFDIVNETKAGNLYGGYYKVFSGAAMTDAEIVAAEYTNGWMTDSNGTAYDAKTANVWKGANAYTTTVEETGGGRGTEMTPVSGTVYYLKEVPNGYIRPYIHYTYDQRAEGNPLKKLYLITATDDQNYKLKGYMIKENEEDAEWVETGVSKASLIITIKKPDGTTDATLTAKKIWDRKIYHGEEVTLSRGYLYNTDFSSYIGKGVTFRPCWRTLDDVLVKGVTVRTVNDADSADSIGVTDVAAGDSGIE